MDRIEEINKLQSSSFKHQKSASTILNNFFALITIVAVSLSVIYYTVYIVPAIEAKEQRELKAKEHQKWLQERERQIALSHKLNKINDTNNTKEKKDDTTK